MRARSAPSLGGGRCRRRGAAAPASPDPSTGVPVLSVAAGGTLLRRWKNRNASAGSVSAGALATDASGVGSGAAAGSSSKPVGPARASAGHTASASAIHSARQPRPRSSGLAIIRRCAPAPRSRWAPRAATSS